jgi:hypothetical protein
VITPPPPARRRLVADGLAWGIWREPRTDALRPAIERLHTARDDDAGRPCDLDDPWERAAWRARWPPSAVWLLAIGGRLAGYCLAEPGWPQVRVTDSWMVPGFARYSPGRLLEAAVLGHYAAAGYGLLDGRLFCIFIHRNTWGECPDLPRVVRNCRLPSRCCGLEYLLAPDRRARYDLVARGETGGWLCTAIVTPRRPFEPASKRRRGFPLASPASSAATASWASTPNWSRNSAAMILARAGPAAAFRRCCRRTGRFDGAPAGYYVRDRDR